MENLINYGQYLDPDLTRPLKIISSTADKELIEQLIENWTTAKNHIKILSGGHYALSNEMSTFLDCPEMGTYILLKWRYNR